MGTRNKIKIMFNLFRKKKQPLPQLSQSEIIDGVVHQKIDKLPENLIIAPKKLRNWYVKSGDLVEKGQDIVRIEAGFHGKKEYFVIKALESGMILKKSFTIRTGNETLCEIKIIDDIKVFQEKLTNPKIIYSGITNNEGNKKTHSYIEEIDFDFLTKLKFNFEEVKDDFTNEVELYSPEFTTVSEKRDIPLSFKFFNKNGANYISFKYYRKHIKLKKGDEIKFLFANGEIITFELTNDPVRLEKDDEGVINQIIEPLSDTALEFLKSQNMTKWRINSFTENREVTGWDFGRKRYFSKENQMRALLGIGRAYVDITSTIIKGKQK